MSNGDEDGDDAADAAEGENGEEAQPPAVTLESRLDDAEASLDAAESEATLDGVASTLDDIAAEIEDADLPEPAEDEEGEEGEDGDEAAEDPRADLEERLETLRTELEEKRGPYAEDVSEAVREAASTLAEGTWTEAGAQSATEAVSSFLMTVDEHVEIPALPEDTVVEDDSEEPTYALPTAVDALEDAAGSIEAADLDPDDDEEVIAQLLEAAETLQDDLEAAEEWSDLSMRDQLDALGFYDVLTSENRIDFPPEWSAMKSYADQGNVEMLLAVLDKMGDADFMEEYVYDQLLHMGKDAAPAFEEMHQRAQKRDKPPIEIVGHVADERACDTLHDFIEGDGDAALQKTTLRALGQIGSRESTQPVANRLDAENDEVRSAAARSLGLIGDTRAIEPLADALDTDGADPDEAEADEVRASAAWALRQIGTERALDELADYADDRSYIVQAEAEKATGV